MRQISLIALLLATACGSADNGQQAAGVETAAASALAASRAKIARIEMNPDVAFLSAEEKQVVNLLIQAGDLMSQIYLRQVSEDNPATRDSIEASNAPDKEALLDMFDLHFGPWDTLEEGKPFFGSKTQPAGAGFYPADLTKADFDAYLAADHRVGRQARRRPLFAGLQAMARAGGEAARAGRGHHQQRQPQALPDAARPGLPHRRLL